MKGPSLDSEQELCLWWEQDYDKFGNTRLFFSIFIARLLTYLPPHTINTSVYKLPYHSAGSWFT
jgi:hypothetical protein